MSMSETVSQPAAKYKSFKYRTAIAWTGARNARMTSEGKPDLQVSSPPEFNGEAGRWTPEDMFVAALNNCTMATFLAFAERKGLPLTAYSCDAEGVLEFAEGSYRFTQVMLKARVSVKSSEYIESAKALMESAHKKCLIANSIRSEVLIDMEVLVADEASS
jgi:peroxiredoxin-like protein